MSEILAKAQAFVDRKYVARADERQKSMGLAYVEAERQDLAREITRFVEGLNDRAPQACRCGPMCEDRHRPGCRRFDVTPTRVALRALVDAVWQHATESTAVPSTDTADRLITKTIIPSHDGPPSAVMPSRDQIARVIYDVENKWIAPNFPADWTPRTFEELSQKEKDLHFDYADAILGLPQSAASTVEPADWQDQFCALRDMWDEDECPSWPDVAETIEHLCRRSYGVPHSAAMTAGDVRYELSKMRADMVDVCNRAADHGGAITTGPLSRYIRQIDDLLAAPTTSPEPAAVREALRAIYEWYDRDGSVGAAADVFEDHRDAVTAALSRPAHGGWEDISTAPKDQRIIGWWPGGEAYPGYVRDSGFGGRRWAPADFIDNGNWSMPERWLSIPRNDRGSQAK